MDETFNEYTARTLLAMIWAMCFISLSVGQCCMFGTAYSWLLSRLLWSMVACS